MSFSDHEVRLWLAANVDVARQDGTAELAEMGESALAAFDRLRARVAELEAASPDDAHTTTETRTEWREVLINDEQFSWSIPASGVAMARKHPAYRVESRTVSTTTRTTDWKADEA